MFAMNFDVLVEESDIYAIDLPGFGRSSRPDFRYALFPLHVHNVFLATI